MYLYLPESVAGIQRHVPDARIVILLRDPADRAYSSYHYLRRQAREPLETFEAALDDEPERIKAGWGPMWHYAAASRYAEQVERYLDAFGDSVELLLYEDLDRDAAGTFTALFTTLGISTEVDIDFEQHNKSGAPRSPLLQRVLTRPGPVRRRLKRILPSGAKRAVERVREQNLDEAPPMSPATRARLVDEFDDDVRRLQALVGRDLGAWRRTEPV
jgi:hypothetical protein